MPTQVGATVEVVSILPGVGDGTTGAVVPINAILNEDGSFILAEDGTVLVQE